MNTRARINLVSGLIALVYYFVVKTFFAFDSKTIYLVVMIGGIVLIVVLVNLIFRGKREG